MVCSSSSVLSCTAHGIRLECLLCSSGHGLLIIIFVRGLIMQVWDCRVSQSSIFGLIDCSDYSCYVMIDIPILLDMGSQNLTINQSMFYRIYQYWDINAGSDGLMNGLMTVMLMFNDDYSCFIFDNLSQNVIYKIILLNFM